MHNLRMIDIQEWEYKSPNYSVEVQIMLLYLCQKWCLILYPGPTGNCYVSIGSAQQSQYINPPPLAAPGPEPLAYTTIGKGPGPSTSYFKRILNNEGPPGAAGVRGRGLTSSWVQVGGAGRGLGAAPRRARLRGVRLRGERGRRRCCHSLRTASRCRRSSADFS